MKDGGWRGVRQEALKCDGEQVIEHVSQVETPIYFCFLTLDFVDINVQSLIFYTNQLM